MARTVAHPAKVPKAIPNNYRHNINISHDTSDVRERTNQAHHVRGRDAGVRVAGQLRRNDTPPRAVGAERGIDLEAAQGIHFYVHRTRVPGQRGLQRKRQSRIVPGLCGQQAAQVQQQIPARQNRLTGPR